MQNLSVRGQYNLTVLSTAMAFVLKINKKEVVFAERTLSGFWFLRFAPLRPQQAGKRASPASSV